MTRTVDIVIAGGGIIGLSAAYQIARRSGLSVLVLDKGAGPGEGSTGASSAVCRFRYTHGEMVNLARDGIAAYQNWSEFLETSDVRAQFHRHSVLWFGDGSDDSIEHEAQRLGTHGIRTAILDDQAITERFPAINPCIVPPDLVDGADHTCRHGGRHLLERDGGYVDPVSALQDLIDASPQRGVDVHFRSEVSDVETDRGRVIGVSLADGETIHCGALIIATGPWCNGLLARVGLDARWPLEPTRIQVVHIDRPADMMGHIPICADPASGIYFRLQNGGQQILVGSVLAADEKERVDPDGFPRYIDDDFARIKLHALHHRLPGLSYARAVHGYSGLYTINRSDVHPVVGQTPVAGLYVANGCSGHGFKLGPAIGSLIAQAITGEKQSFDTDVDPAFLAFDRKPLILQSKTALA